MMRIDSLRMVELLSLEDKHGRCVMRLGVGLDHEGIEGARELEVELDQTTYLELAKLDPLSTGRVRLSLYTKYDPFRQTYFGSIVKLSKTGSESYYFDCTAEYEAMLGRLRNGEISELASESEHVTAPLEAGEIVAEAPAIRTSLGAVAGALTAPLRLRMRMGRPALASLRLLLLTCMFLLVWFEVEGQLYIDDAKALSEHHLVAQDGTGDGVSVAAAAEVTSETVAVNAANTGSQTGLAQPATNGSIHAELAQPLMNESSHPDLARSAWIGEAGLGGTTATGGTVEAGSGSAGAEDATNPASDNEFVEMITLAGDAPLYKLPSGYVALTFDDGPSDYTKAIVDILRERGVAGTFLFVGRNADRYPEEAAYASENGMAVGNHSWDHSRLPEIKIDDISANIEKANEAIAKRSSSPVSVFRPPYGAMNDDLELAAAELGMKLLMWNRDPEDWKADTASEIIQYFKQLSASGGIYVMHEKKATLDALPDIIDYLLEQKLKFAVFQ